MLQESEKVAAEGREMQHKCTNIRPRLEGVSSFLQKDGELQICRPGQEKPRPNDECKELYREVYTSTVYEASSRCWPGLVWQFGIVCLLFNYSNLGISQSQSTREATVSGSTLFPW